MFAYGLKSLEGRKGSPTGLVGFPSVKILAGGESSNRLLVLGVIDELVRDMIRFGTTIGWSIFGCNEVGSFKRAADVHWLHRQYFDKVPARDAPEFSALLIAPSFSCRAAVNRVVEKFRVRRIAIIQLAASSDRSNENDLAKLFKAEAFNEPLAGELMKDSVLDCEIGLFSWSSSESVMKEHAVGSRRDQRIQDCFSWLSK